MTKTLLYSIVCICTALLCSNVVFSQTIFQPGQAAKFGIDGDISSDVRQNGTFTAAGSHDWFKKTGGTGLGLIDTTGQTTLRTQIIGGSNITFTKRMQFTRYSVQDGVVMMDACYARDYMGTDKTAYSGNGTKNTASPLAWGTAPNGGSVSDKTDIIDSYVSMRRVGTTLVGSNLGNLVATMGLSTLSTNGDRYADFEFYKERIDYNTTTGQFSNSGPAAYGGHSLWEFNADGSVKAWGDMIISFTFSSSTVSDIKVYIWVTQTTYQNVNPQGFDFAVNDFNASTSVTGYGYAAIKPNGGGQLAAFGSVNTANTATPFWGSNSKDLGNNGNNYFSDLYSPGQFAEAAVDLTMLGIDPATFMNMTACSPPFTRFLTKSRSSSSFSSSLSDFNGPFEFLDVPSVPAGIAPPANLSCAVTSVTLSTANYTSGAYYNWTTNNGSVVGSNGDSSSITVNKPGTYYLKAAVTQGCMYNVDSVVVTEDKWKPKATASVAGMLYASQTVQLYGGDTILSNYSTPFGGSKGLKWEWTGPFGFYATWQNPITGSPGWHTLVVTEKRNGCKDTATVYVIPYPILAVRFTSFTVNNTSSKNLLHWTIADAAGATEFQVEKSTDGLQFTALAQVKADGKKTAYEFADMGIATPCYYRITAVDYASKQTHSAVVKVSAGVVQKAPLVYRSGDNLVLQYEALQDEPILVHVLTANGQLVWKGQLAARAGTNNWQPTLPGKLAESIYLVHIQGAKNSTSAKLKW